MIRVFIIVFLSLIFLGSGVCLAKGVNIPKGGGEVRHKELESDFKIGRSNENKQGKGFMFNRDREDEKSKKDKSGAKNENKR